jgi:hypothetical protein
MTLFFDRSQQRVDAVDISILSAQLFFGLKGNWEYQLSKKYALGQNDRIDFRISATLHSRGVALRHQ